MPFKRKVLFNNSRNGFVKLWLILFLIIIFIGLIDFKIRPTIKTISSYRAKIFAGKVISDAVSEELAKEKITYSSLIQINTDETGMLTAVQTDIVSLNILRSNIMKAVINDINFITNDNIDIPLGTLTGLQILSGRGPKISFKIVPTGYIETVLENEFSSAGINQTRHQIMLRINLNITTILPGYTTTTAVNTNYCLAETIIVGAVPEAFTEVMDSQDVTGKIFDHGAERRYSRTDED